MSEPMSKSKMISWTLLKLTTAYDNVYFIRNRYYGKLPTKVWLKQLNRFSAIEGYVATTSGLQNSHGLNTFIDSSI